MTDLRTEALDYARRLAAALERHNEETQPQQIEALRLQLAEALDNARAAELEQFNAEKRADELGAELDKVRLSLEHAMGAARFAKSTLRGVPVGRIAGAGATLSLLESAAIEARKEIEDLRADLRKEQKIKDFVNDECQRVRAALGLGRMAQASEVLAAIDALQVDRSMQRHTVDVLRGRVNDLQEQIAKAAPVESDKKLADALKMRLAEANDRIRHMTDVIKELHAQYHELEARKMATQYDLDRAKEEIAFAEAEIAKYKPLVDAVRAGHVYGCSGKWVRVKAATVADLNEGTAVSFFIPNSEDPQCL